MSEKAGPERGRGRDLPGVTLGQPERALEPGDPLPSYARRRPDSRFSRMRLLGEEAVSPPNPSALTLLTH